MVIIFTNSAAISTLDCSSAFGATVAFGMKKAIDAASDLEETASKFGVVFAGSWY